LLDRRASLLADFADRVSIRFQTAQRKQAPSTRDEIERYKQIIALYKEEQERVKQVLEEGK
jgi:hypothetical protein